jgi:CrcB protein
MARRQADRRAARTHAHAHADASAMNAMGFVAVGAGAALGAWLRWALSTWFNHLFINLPLGTLASNIIGGYLIGIAAAFFALRHELPPEIRLFAITGVLGGFTTFSAFSSEVVSLAAEGRAAWATLTAAAHLVGSLALTALGILTVRIMSNPLS